MIYNTFAITYERTEYAKKIRKLYESHKVQERRCRMRRRSIRTDGIGNTITGVLKDFYVLVVEDDR